MLAAVRARLPVAQRLIVLGVLDRGSASEDLETEDARACARGYLRVRSLWRRRGGGLGVWVPGGMRVPGRGGRGPTGLMDEP